MIEVSYPAQVVVPDASARRERAAIMSGGAVQMRSFRNLLSPVWLGSRSA